MQVRADRVSLEGHHGTLLPPTSLTVGEGDLAIVHGEPGVGVTAFGLALAGRLKPSTGTVTVDGSDAGLPALVAVVDAPEVSEPDDALPLRVVVGEELALAHRPAGKEDVARWLTEHDAAPYSRHPVREPHPRPAHPAAHRAGRGAQGRARPRARHPRPAHQRRRQLGRTGPRAGRTRPRRGRADRHDAGCPRCPSPPRASARPSSRSRSTAFPNSPSPPKSSL